MSPKHARSEAGSSAQPGPARGRKSSKSTAEPEPESEPEPEFESELEFDSELEVEYEPEFESEFEFESEPEIEAEEEGGGSSAGRHHEEQGHEHGHDDLENRPPYEYYCMNRPFFDVANENAEKDDPIDENKLVKKFNKGVRSGGSIATEPAAQHPGYRWICMWETWKMYCDLKRRATYTDPDLFNMWIYNDFHGYGLQELIESVLLAFDKELEKKKRDENSLKKMWATMAALVHWLLNDELGAWEMIDDGARFRSTTELIERAFLTLLDELDQAQMLKADSDIKDLGLVIAYYLQWMEGLFGLGCEQDFRKELVAYAEKAGIDLRNAGCHDTEAQVNELYVDFGSIEPISGDARPDRWNFKKDFKKFAKNWQIEITDKYNILKMSRRSRAGHAFDHKDPLAGIPEKHIKEGNIMIA
ncbi:hypothetical protein F4779DRAFT_92148 [Xylariaceae sp. FL0662B]|nr:hypothetical protein F4779DRAFT_92148 [Xylariaceae sp. FL0662B]